MKTTVFVSIAAILIIVVVSGVHSKLDGSGTNRRVARGFRLGAADRFSHGFGKRADNGLLEYLADSSPDFALPNEEFAELLRSSEHLASLFVRHTVDKNGDGLISREELLGYQN